MYIIREQLRFFRTSRAEASPGEARYSQSPQASARKHYDYTIVAANICSDK